MTERQRNRRQPGNWVSSNAVVTATQDGVASFLERLSRMLKRAEFRGNESSEILKAVEQVLLVTVGQAESSDSPPESHAFFTIGPTDFSIRIENQLVQCTPTMLSGAGEPATASDLALGAVSRLMDEVRCNAKGDAVTLVRRRGVNRTARDKARTSGRLPQTNS